MLRSRLVRPTFVTALLVVAATAPTAAASVSASDAARKALAALDVRSGSDPVVVFRQPGTVPARAAIRQAGTRTADQARAGRGADAALRRAGVTTIDAPLVLRGDDERSWLFYEDQAPYQAHQHAGRVVLVGARSGRVRVSSSLQWPPLIDGRLPAFLTDFDAYRAERHRIFVRAWRLAEDTARSRADAVPGGTLIDRRTPVYGPVETTLDPEQRALARAATPGASSAHQRAADRLAAERSCVIRISDTLGDFYDAGPVDRTRAEFGSAFVRLARQNAGFHTARYRYRDGRTPASFVRRTIQRAGCRDVLVYVAGGGYRQGAPAVNVGTRVHSGGRLDQQLVTAGDLRAMARASRDVTFKVVVDAPYSGGFLPALRGERNITLLLTSSGDRDGSFVALGSVVDRDGRPVENRYNGRRYLEFTNRLLEGLQCFLSRPAEVDHAIALQDAGRLPSFLAWMVDRGFSLCAEGSVADRVENAPRPTVFRRGPTPTAPTGSVPPVPPAPSPQERPNAAPTALAATVVTSEDRAVELRPSGTDPDGDPLTVAIVDRPEHGALTGEGDRWSYAPDPDFHGGDRVTFTVSDGRATSAPATIAIDVTPVNDAPTVGGVGSVTYAEGQPPVAVAPAAVLADVDDAGLVGVTVRIGDGLHAVEDRLAVTAPPGISAGYDAASGTLTLTGSASVADYQAALRSVTYENLGGDDPAGETRTFTVVADDGDDESDPAAGAIAVAPVNDAPVLGGGGNTVVFPEDDVDGVVVNPGVTVADPDSATLRGAIVRIATGLAASEDRLLFVDQAGISGSYDAATGTLTLTGSASVAAYQAALRSVRYRNLETGQPSTTPRQVEFTVDDGAATSNVSVAIVSTVDISPSDDPPQLTAGGATAAFVEGGAAVAVDPGLTIVDPDDATLTGAQVFVEFFVGAEDALVFVNQNGITGSYNASTGVLTLTGTASVAEYQAALRSVRYLNTDADSPSVTVRSVNFVVESNGRWSNTVFTDVTVSAVNDAPSVTTSSGSAAFVEDGGAVVVDSGITVSDVDDTTLTGATVQLGTTLLPQPGTLSVVDTAEILGVWNPTTATLTLSGTASVAAYQAALRTVRFDDPSDTPDTADRTVRFTVSDAADDSAEASRTVTVAATDDPPTVTAGGTSPTYTEGDPGVTVDPGLTVADADSASLTAATVTIGAGHAASEDELAYTTIHGITGTFDAATGTLALTGTATPAQYQAALRSVRYVNTSSSPSTADRAIGFTVSDGTSTSASASTTVHVAAVNTPPTLSGGGNTVSYAEGDPAIPVNPAIVVSDPDDVELSGAKVAVSAGFVAAEDRLDFDDQNGITGSYDDETGELSLTGAATLAEYQAALRTVAYRNVDEISPTTADRTVTFTADDGDDESTPVTSTVEVSMVPDAPAVGTDADGEATFVEGGAAVVIDGALTVADPDSTALSGATVRIAGGFSAAQGDELGFTNQNGITGSYDAATGELTLSGSSSPANYQTALRSVTFSNTSQAPTTSRTIGFVVRDESGAENVEATQTVTIAPVNDAPTIAGGGSQAYTENDPATVISPLLTVDDVDSPTLASAKVTISSGFESGKDILSISGGLPTGFGGTYDAVAGTWTITASVSKTAADFQALLRQVRFHSTSEDPSATPRTITYTVTDGGSPTLSDSTTATVAVIPVNDAPVAPNVTFDGTTAAIGNTTLVGDDATDGAPSVSGPSRGIGSTLRSGASDVDSPADDLELVAQTVPTTDGGTAVIEADGDFVYRPKAGTSCTDTTDGFSYKVTDGDATDPRTTTGQVTVKLTGCVWYVRNDAAAGGDGRSGEPFDTLAEADAAAITDGATIYVYRGDGTTTGLTGGVTLGADQRLIGGTRDLTVAGTTLVAGDGAQRPSLSGQIDLASGNVLEGFATSATAAPAISGAAGDASGTIRDLVVSASGSAGTGLSLNGTSGTWALSDLVVAGTGGAAGIVAQNAGTVQFADAGTITVSAAGPALTLTGSALAGTIDRTTASGSATHGVRIQDTTGELTLDDVHLTATGTGLQLNDASGITVRTQAGASGTISSASTAVDVSADAGVPAVAPKVELNNVTSFGGTVGIRFATPGAATFSAAGGSLSGHSDAELSVVGGSGAISYGGSIGNGSGLSARVDDRTGGTVALSGSITDTNDAGGGIAMSGNSGGSTTFSGATKTLNTGSADAVRLSYSGNHAVRFAGGALDIDTTSGRGLHATSSAGGTLAVEGSGNSITTSTGVPLEVSGPDLTAAGATFSSITSNGAPSGIVLANTGSAGGLTVTGTGTAGTGGTIAASTGAGIALTDVGTVSLADVNVINGQDDGIRGAGVAGLTLTRGQVTGNGNAAGEHGLDLSELAGIATISGATVTGNAEDNLRVVNDAATLTNLTVSGGTFGRNHGSSVGGDSILVKNTGSGDTTATISGVTFDRSRGDHVQVTTDAATDAVQNVTISANQMTGDGNQPGAQTLGGGVTVNPAGNATTTVRVLGNQIQRAFDSAIVVNSPLGSSAQVHATIDANIIGSAGESKSGSATGDGIFVNGHGSSTITTAITNNQVANWTNPYGIDLVHNDGNGGINATVTGNRLSTPAPLALSGVRVLIGSEETDAGASCVDLGSTSNPTGLGNRLAGTATAGQSDIRLRMAGGPQSTLRLPGYTGTATDATAVQNYLIARNTVDAAPTASVSLVSPTGGVTGGAACPLPQP